MPINYSEHAKLQIKRRKISKKQIEKAVISPDKIKPSFRERKLRQLRIGDKILEVITKTEGSKITVITAYFVEE